MTTQPAPAPTPTADPWYVWSNGTEDGSWHQVNQGTRDECRTFADVHLNPNLYIQQPGVMYLVLEDGKTPTAVVERHKFHGHAEYASFCQICLHEERETSARIEAEHGAEIDRQTCILADQVGTALAAVMKGQDAIAKLIGPLYDVEFSEGMEGPDVLAGLNTAARELRNVERIVMRRREYLLEQDRHAREAAEAERIAAVLAERRRQHEDVRPGDEGTCGASVYPEDPDRDVMCMLPPHASYVPHDPCDGTDPQA